ncbi:MAG: hypothetical protein H7A25_03545 [Leptospiraceae bacterium]|nr:hypothetical protein [Leptospiraceae bacterium]MCP5498950.1 hypothetical protein [Leptospiraceae bacterium]
MESLNYPLSNIQLELLKLFSNDVKEEDLIQIKKIISTYFANKAIESADSIWENIDTEKLLNSHLRTEYKK